MKLLTKHRQALTVVTAAAVLALTAGGGAVAGSLITSKDIQDKTIRGVDIHKNAVKTQKVKDGSLRLSDLNAKARAAIEKAGPAGKDGKDADPAKIKALEAQIAALETRVTKLEAQDASGVNTNWAAGQGSTIVDAHTVRLVLAAGNNAGTSVEIQNLDLPVQATKTVTFTYKLENGAQYTTGAPRVFIEIGGTYYNTFDADPTDAGTANGDGTFTKTWTIPVNGRVGNAGIVYDNNIPGTVTVKNLTISGQLISFQ
ncbi:hypothetical protein ISU07_20150 [Nocardioides islandensis]|jgi:hypothetical protein|uniref:DUF4352 domain-containing protein n=1 Tax=Nocardioides islandensis TaxID=433663 RepID=A0A930YMB5_9ACTN|nr:hypothetical protein [Nocardioides islandensis]MBF4765450.1 hypothetical protein [Nocardioides islandensis]